MEPRSEGMPLIRYFTYIPHEARGEIKVERKCPMKPSEPSEPSP